MKHLGETALTTALIAKGLWVGALYLKDIYMPTIEEIQEAIRYSMEIEGIKISDSQWEQIKAAAKYLEGSVQGAQTDLKSVANT